MSNQGFQTKFDNPLGFSQITGMSASTGLGSVPAGTTRALIQAEAQTIRWRDDGTAPTATVGMNLLVGIVLEYRGVMSAFKMIQATSGAIANVSYYG